MRRPAVALAVAVLLAGCMGAEEAPPVDAASAAAADDAPALPVAENATSPADLTGGQAPHIHDYWGGRDRVTLFDDAVQVRVLSSATFVSVFLRGDPALGGTFWELPEGQTVYEGTGLLEVTASWTDPTVTGLGFAYKPANEPETRNAYDEATALTNGQPFGVEVTPEMTDMPHDAVSRWQFLFAAEGTPAVAEGTVQLKVEIVRMRDVTRFPGHPDTYEDTDRYVLEDADFAYRRPSFATFVVDNLQGRDTTPIVPDRPVPMETRALVVELTVTGVSSSAPGTAVDGIDLVYRAADGERYMAQLLEANDPVYVFGIPVRDAEVDSPYGEHSAWRLAPFARTSTAGVDGCEFCVDAEVSGHAVITAYAVDPTGKITDERDEI